MHTSRFKQLILVSGFAGVLLLLGGRSTHAESLPATLPAIDTAERSSALATLEAERSQVPGTVNTSAASLQADVLTAQAVEPTPEAAPEPIQTTPEPIQTTPEAMPVVPTQAVIPGRATQAGPSYVGVGGNIGFGGRTDLGRGSFTVFSKIGLTNNLSARPAINASRNPALLLPITFDFPLRSVDGRVSVAPYVGGGAVLSTGRDSAVRGLLTGGVDVPLSDQFTANAAVNVGFFGKTEVGLRLGVGYNF
ncbi:MAG: hypothetical protein RBJ76_18195 [Stenomitos frigidus ULC029]